MTEERKNILNIDDDDVDDNFDEEDDLEEEDLEDEEELDEEKEKTDKSEEDDKKEKSKKVQDEAERSRQAKARREREAKEREEREKAIEAKAYLKGQLDSTKVNSYTNEPIENEYDLEVFKIQVQLEKEGKDPISDLPKRIAELNRSAGEKARTEAEEKKARNDAIDNDIANFKAKYPNINLAELLKDPDFKEYSDGRLGIKGGKSLATIYEDFEKFKSRFVSKAEDNDNDDGKKSTPSPNGQKHTRSSYSGMSEEEKIKELKRQGLI